MKQFLLILTLCLSILSFAKDRPNVIVVLADDIGVGDISHYRKMNTNTIVLETPHIDKIANQGMVFTQAHAPAALCAPSRYAVMTGNSCYHSPFPWGVWGAYQESPIAKNQLTLGKLMQQAGYKTSFFGKWHLGGDYMRKDNSSEIYRGPRNKPELDVDITKIIDGPNQKGFDYSFTYPAGIQASPYAVYENGDWYPLSDNSEIGFVSQENMSKIGVKLDKLEGLGDLAWNPHNMGPLLVHKAVDFIKANANKKEPFFMYYCSQAVHLPHTPSAQLNGVKIAGTTPSKHMDMIKELDVQMGMLIEELKAQGEYENTVFIFTSDNGGLHTSKATLNSGHQPSDIYRGSKNSPFEGGHRVPFIVSWPTKIKANQQSNEPILGLDIMATLAAITKQKIPEGQAVDSYNLLPVLTNKKNADGHAFLMVQGGTGKEVILIENGWKLIIQVDKKDKTNSSRKPIALFNLNENPQELEEKNLINAENHQDQINSMFEKYNRIRDNKIPIGS